MEQLFFYIFAFLAVLSAVLVISVRNPVHSALYLIVCFLQVAAIFILLRSPFLAAVQVFIYVGAVMVLFLFAVMVLDLGREKFKEHMHSQTVPAIAVLIALFIVMGMLMISGRITAPLGPFNEPALVKNTEVIGRSLYTTYIFPFEVVSILLLIALIGAIVLVMRGKGNKAE
ncbi:MAG: NADH-quinone oxidoreductase subunit J [Deltaproteobacteria bacterium]|nr:NADH-quinone oxidoreductase subunit J [Deltaproteobacteria bacterium]